MNRKEVLDEAAKAVLQDRNQTHGPVEDIFGTIADLWNVYLENTKGPLNSYNVAHMMILLKIARAQQNPKHADNHVDMAGYAACGAELADG